MIRDKEIERLTKYAEAMGVDVLFSKKETDEGASAEWHTDGKKIIVYTKEHSSKIELVLSLIHEIGHHLEYVRSNNRVVDEKLDEALSSEEEKKRDRKKILDWEAKSSDWWYQIYQDTDCKFPLNKLYAQKDLDIYQYEIYYETGKFPTRKMNRKKWKEIKNKYKI